MKKITIQQRSEALLSKLSQFMPDFESREAQQRLIAGIAHITQNSMDEKTPRHMIAECPTGSGKSISSLIPAKAYLDSLHEDNIEDVRVIYATATVSLQNQLLKDIDLLKSAGIPINSHVAVGRARFFCKKHAQILTQSEQDNQEKLSFDDGIEGFALPNDVVEITDVDKRKINTLFSALEDGRWTGMKDDLSEAMSVNAVLWDKVKSDANTCSSQCRFYGKETCPFVANRQKMGDADIIITNQSMLFTDLDNARVLPDVEKSLVIVDEGHHAFSNFAKQQDSSVAVNSLLTMSNKHSLFISNGIDLIYKQTKTRPEVSTQKIQSMFSELQNELTNFVRELDRCFKHATQHQNTFERAQGNWEMKIGDIHKYALVIPIENIEAIINKLQGWLSRAIEVGKKGDADDLLTSIMAKISEQLSTIEDAQKTLDYFLRAEQYAPIALWCRTTGENAGQITMNASRVDMSQLMREKFWDRVKHCVLMSATLRTNGQFDRICSQMGIDKTLAHVTALPSPFEDAYHNSTLHLYPNIPEPNWKDTRKHSQAVSDHTTEFMIYHHAGLLLVNSRKQMEEIVSLLPAHIASIALVQGGNVSRQILVKQHIERVESGNKSLLIGMASFGEGLDLKGDLLTFVGICKLNFGHSSDPRTNAESNHIKNIGGNPFQELILPETEKNLQQCVGRLIRSIKDTGEIAIFDSRCVTKGYGSSLINGLPNFYIQTNQMRASA